MAVDTDLFPARYPSPQLIGHGGMGDIYSATDETLGRTVAIKVLAERYADDEAIRGRFTREALAAARLSGDPNTVTIFDVGEWNGRPFIVMEYLSGGSLEKRLRDEGAQEYGQALRWLDQTARALDAARAEGVVHRDVKPGNLLLDAEGNVHVADFGIATAAGLDSVTQTGTIIGTAGYLSPEQAQGERATSASDVYALGVVAFELLTGERPYQSESTTAEAAAHAHAPIPSISERDPTLPPELDAVFRRVLAKDPQERYETGGEFVAALARPLRRRAAPIAGQPPPPQEPPTLPMRPAYGEPAPRRSRLPVLPIVVALVLLLGASGAVLAALLSGGDDNAGATTFVTTIRERGRTETVTTTTQAPPPPAAETQPPAPPPPPPPEQTPTGTSGAALNDAGFRKMQAGDYAGALPLLEQAVQKLQGANTDLEAYALYNLAFTRFQLGRCDGELEMLDRSEAIQGHRDEIDSLRAQAQERC